MSRSAQTTLGFLRFLQGLVAVLVLGAVGVLTFHRYESHMKPVFGPNRGPAATAFLDLSTGWEFALANEERTPESVMGDRSLRWDAFDPVDPIAWGDRIQGHYWLRKSFDVAPPLRHPSLVLGLVANHHRTYLNGKFVGGSDYWEHIAQYSVDSALLRSDRPNWIYVQAHTPKVLRPGILKLGHVGIGLGEFGEIQRAIQRDTMEFFVLRTVYLVVTFLASLLCLFYWAFHRERKHLLYFSLYLCSGGALLLYYNFYVITALDYPFYNFLKVFALGSATFVLSSAFSFLGGFRRWEVVGNGAGALFAAVSFLVLVPPELTVAAYYGRLVACFRVAAVVTGLWLVPAICLWLRQLWTTVREKEAVHANLIYGGILCLSGTFTLVLLLQSAGWIGDADSLTRRLLTPISVSHSFLFSLVLLFMTSLEHIRAGKRLEFELEKDRFNLELVRGLAFAEDSGSMIHLILEKMCRLLDCERSTLYLVENEAKHRFLEASYIFGDRSATSLVQKVLSPERGLIGRVMASREPLLITDSDDLPNSGDRAYKTKSCLLVPLILEKQFIGILTVADRCDGKVFNRRHLDAVTAICKDLALICKITRLEGSLKRQLDGIIAALAKMIEKRDPYTEFHSQGVMYVAERIAAELGREPSMDLRIAALLHDVGKIFVPSRVLNKPGPLNAHERDYIQKHSRWSSEILKSIPGFEEIAQWAGLHHESIDGKGYPYGLTEDLIPIEAQIISVADFVDALATHRAYRPKFDHGQIEAMLREGATARRFDPTLVDAALTVLKSPDFRKLYSERGASYRPEGSADQVAFDYYMEPFVDFITTLDELNGFLESQARELSPEVLHRTVSSIRRIGEELTQLAGQVGKNLRESGRNGKKASVA